MKLYTQKNALLPKVPDVNDPVALRKFLEDLIDSISRLNRTISDDLDAINVEIEAIKTYVGM